MVTNATMEHFWLNEGFTTWAERRLLAALYGDEVGVITWAIGQHALERAAPVMRRRHQHAAVGKRRRWR